RLQHLAVGELAGRTDDERDRPGQVAAGVRVRPADVGEQQALLAQVLGQPGGVHDRGEVVRHSCSRNESSARLNSSGCSALTRWPAPTTSSKLPCAAESASSRAVSTGTIGSESPTTTR